MSRQSTGLSRDEKKRQHKAADVTDLYSPLEGDRLIFKPELLDRVGLSFANVWKLMREGTFPRARVAGGRSAWLASEIDGWIRKLPRRRLKGDSDEGDK